MKVRPTGSGSANPVGLHHRLKFGAIRRSRNALTASWQLTGY